jgi:tetratricopeptide (TPR) repeat protein
MNKNLNKKQVFGVCLVLAISTFAVFYQVHSFDFVNYDDPSYLYENSHIRNGLTVEAVRWAFNIGYAANWHPLTWLSHILDWQLFGNNAGGHHLTNLFFHIANTLLLFIVLKQMTNALWQSAFVAALFALHPLHVESVAWISERKDVLSTFFLFLTMWAYLKYVRKPKIWRYLLIVLLFALGLMSKPMLVTLPFVLLLLDYWPLERFGKQKTLYLILEKVPLFILSASSSIFTFLAQRSGGAVMPLDRISLSIRLSNAVISYVQYIGKMFWPVKLAVFYRHPVQNISFSYTVISALILLIVTVIIFAFAKKHRYLFTGWFWYLGTLVPVIGIIQVGSQAMADRYTYITLTGLFIIIVWGLPELLAKLRYRRTILWASSMSVLFILSGLTYRQVQYWGNTVTLGSHALAVTENNWNVHFFMADMYFKQGRFDESVRHNAEAVRIRPDSAVAANRLGWSLYAAGRLDEAIGYYQKALSIDSRFALANTNLGTALSDKGRFNQAVRCFKAALETADTPHIRSELGYALLNLGRFQEAVIEYRKVLLEMPDSPDILNRLGYALMNSGEFDEAISLYNKALYIAPHRVDIRLNLGVALVNSGRLEDAIREYQKVLLARPQNALAHNDLGVIFSQQGEFDQAVLHFNKAFQIDPNYTAAKNNLNAALAEKQKTQK